MTVNFWLRLLIVFFVAIYNYSGTSVHALPINTDIAIQPAEGELIYRSQVRYTHASEESGDPNGELDRILLPQTFVYGFSPEFSAVVKIPMRYDHLRGRAPETNDLGVADIQALGRYQIWKEQAYLENSSLTVLGGLELPSGDSTFSSRSFDPILGFVFNRNQDRIGSYFDLTYQFNTENSDDFEEGDELKWDAALEWRLFPAEWSGDDEYSISLLIELNGIYKQKSTSATGTINGSGGTTVFISPGIQIQWKQMVLESSLLLPVIQNLRGDQLEIDVVVVTSVRFFF